jgi:hypothetical protein
LTFLAKGAICNELFLQTSKGIQHGGVMGKQTVYPARFEVCECSARYGYVIFSDRSWSGKLRTKEEAIILVMYSVTQKYMTRDESVAVIKEIIDSPLPAFPGVDDELDFGDSVTRAVGAAPPFFITPEENAAAASN